eukprot:2982640-Ditylum_brightwellii.AAC.1
MRGQMGMCESCAVGKVKQKNTPNLSEHAKSEKLVQRIFLEISTIEGEKDGPIVNAKNQW